jgi:hypothetical protein
MAKQTVSRSPKTKPRFKSKIKSPIRREIKPQTPPATQPQSSPLLEPQIHFGPLSGNAPFAPPAGIIYWPPHPNTDRIVVADPHWGCITCSLTPQIIENGIAGKANQVPGAAGDIATLDGMGNLKDSMVSLTTLQNTITSLQSGMAGNQVSGTAGDIVTFGANNTLADSNTSLTTLQNTIASLQSGMAGNQVSGTAGDIVTFGASNTLTDSNTSLATLQNTITTLQNGLAAKANQVPGAVGDIATLDGTGNLKDSGTTISALIASLTASGAGPNLVVVNSAAALINALPTTGGGSTITSPGGLTIYVLPGIYNFTAPITVQDSVTLRGCGRGSTILNFANGDGVLLSTPASGSGFTDLVTISDLTIVAAGRGIAANAPHTTNLTHIVIRDVQVSAQGVAIDLNPGGATHANATTQAVYTQDSLIEGVFFNSCGATWITMAGNVNTLRRIDGGGTPSTAIGTVNANVANGSICLLGGIFTLENVIVEGFGNINGAQLPAALYLADGEFVLDNCHIEGPYANGINLWGSKLIISNLNWVPNSPTAATTTPDIAINAQRFTDSGGTAHDCSIFQEIVDLQSTLDLTQKLQTPWVFGSNLPYLQVDQFTTVQIGTVLNTLDVGHLNDPNILISRTSTMVAGAPTRSLLDYPPAVRQPNLLPAINTWTAALVTAQLGAIISNSGTRTRADGKATEFFITFSAGSSVSGRAKIDFTNLNNSLLNPAPTDFTFQANLGVPANATLGSGDQVFVYINNSSQQLPIRQVNSLTATRFTAATALTDLVIQLVNPLPGGTYTFNDVGLFVSF